MSPPWLTAVIPTYNGARFLSAALQSVVDQRDDGLEVVIVDDGSTDGTLQVARQFDSRLRLTIVESDHVGNWVVNSNRGLKLARTEYSTLLHQDDRWIPRRLATVYASLKAHPEATLLIHAVRVVNSAGASMGALDCPFPRLQGPLNGRLVGRRLLVQNSISCCGAVFRSDAFEAVGAMDEALWYAADWDLWLKLVANGTVLYLPERLADLRVHAESQSMRRVTECDDLVAQLEQVWERYWQEYCPPNERLQSQRLVSVSRLSLDLNATIVRRIAGRSIRNELLRLGLQFLALGPSGWHHFVRDSRIIQRAWCRRRVQS